jgi:hypothetical protein
MRVTQTWNVEVDDEDAAEVAFNDPAFSYGVEEYLRRRGIVVKEAVVVQQSIERD